MLCAFSVSSYWNHSRKLKQNCGARIGNIQSVLDSFKDSAISACVFIKICWRNLALFSANPINFFCALIPWNSMCWFGEITLNRWNHLIYFVQSLAWIISSVEYNFAEEILVRVKLNCLWYMICLCSVKSAKANFKSSWRKVITWIIHVWYLMMIWDVLIWLIEALNTLVLFLCNNSEQLVEFEVDSRYWDIWSNIWSFKRLWLRIQEISMWEWFQLFKLEINNEVASIEIRQFNLEVNNSWWVKGNSVRCN